MSKPTYLFLLLFQDGTYQERPWTGRGACPHFITAYKEHERIPLALQFEQANKEVVSQRSYQLNKIAIDLTSAVPVVVYKEIR